MMNMPIAVKKVFDSYPEQLREKLLFLRQLILDVAASLELEELLEDAASLERMNSREGRLSLS